MTRVNIVLLLALIATGVALVRVAYDSIGKATFATTLECLAPRGLFVSFGAASGAPPAVEANALREAGALYFTRPALNVYVATRAELEASAGAVFDLVLEGVLKPHIHARHALADVAKALGPEDISAVSQWLAAQPVPVPAKAADALPTPAPKPCGGGVR